MATGRTGPLGEFLFSNMASGVYEIVVDSEIVEGRFSVQVRGAGIFHWFPKNYLELGLAIPRELCLPSYVRAVRGRAQYKKLPNTPLQPTAEKRGG